MAPLVTRLAPVLLLLAGISACGSDDPEPTSEPTAQATTGFTVEEGVAPDDLLGCLEEAGIPVTAKDSTPMGVDVPVEGLEVGPLEGGTSGDSPQGADLWVFTTAAAASENRVAITLADEDTPSSWVAGNVVVRLFHPAADDDLQIRALQECLPT